MKIGLMMPLGERETERSPIPYSDLREMALRAETDGLDSLWVADHLLFREEEGTFGIHEAWTMLTAFAAVTSRVAVGTLVLALPFRNPGVTAKMASALDEVSGGRLILGSAAAGTSRSSRPSTSPSTIGSRASRRRPRSSPGCCATARPTSRVSIMRLARMSCGHPRRPATHRS